MKCCHLFTCDFEKSIKLSVNEFDLTFGFCVSLRCFTWLCGLKQIHIKLQTLQDKEVFLSSERNIRRRVASAQGKRFAESYENERIL